MADSAPDKSQAEKFADLARELGCEGDEAAFDERLRQIAPKVGDTRERPAPMMRSATPETDAFVKMWLLDNSRLLEQMVEGHMETLRVRQIALMALAAQTDPEP